MKDAIICFTRVPRPGKTKTRLLPILSGEYCAGLHTSFLRDLAGIYGAVDADLYISYAEDPDWTDLQIIFPEAVAFFPQVGTDLGEKMLHAISHVLTLGYDKCILTGADLPEMTAGHLTDGLTALDSADVVIGPTGDGGYYLVGMKLPCPAVFQGQQYGCATVYERTVAAAKAANLTVAAAPLCSDVDTPEDLRRLAEICNPISYTGQYLEKLKKEGILL